MNTKTFYRARQHTFLVLLPENPQDSDAELSDEDDDDDKIGNPDYQAAQAEETGDTSLEVMDEEEVVTTISSSKPPSHDKKRKEKNTLHTVSLAEPENSPESSSPLDTNNGTRRIWKYKDTDSFQALKATFDLPDSVKTPFKMLFTDKMVEHIAQHTNLYSAWELGEPISTSHEETEESWQHYSSWVFSTSRLWRTGVQTDFTKSDPFLRCFVSCLS